MGNGSAPASNEDGRVEAAELSRRYRTVLLRYFARRGIAPEDSQDLAQEVFMRLVRQQNLAPIENIEGYLFATAGNIALDSFRRGKTRRDHPAERWVEDLQRMEEFTPLRLLEGREELAGIVAALNEMPERMRNIFILARLENLPRAEIADRLGISKRLVEQQITLATACLADRRRRIT